MRYISTRGNAPALEFEDVLLTGLARDGGLYVPDMWPTFTADELRGLRGKSFAEVAAHVLSRFTGDSVSSTELLHLCRDSYAGFDHAAVAPLVQLDQRTWLLELFHGPTLAFKDMALQVLGRLFDRALSRRGERVTIVGATSGDTGSAALEACRDRSAIDIFILYPQGRTSEVQRRQMTTVDSANCHAIAIEGTFDDCQDIVKAMFNDARFRDELRLSAVNSINWARIVAQVAYYVASAVALGAPDRDIGFAVPTGNFGNVYAAYAARACGVPIPHLVVGTNRNDILTRFFVSGTMSAAPVMPTISPSMDIQISSNFERLLFDLHGRDGGKVVEAMQAFRAMGAFSVTPEQYAQAKALFSAYRADDAETQETIRATYLTTGYLADPHTAVGLHAARQAQASLRSDVPLVALACAHPAKFPDAVETVSGVRPALPPRLADLYERPERTTVLPNDLKAVQAYVAARSRVTGAAA